MLMDYLRYDRLYSKNELIVLFCGTEKKAQDLDERIIRLNVSFTRGHFNRNFPSRPEIRNACPDIGTMVGRELLADKAIRAYSLSLEEIPNVGKQLVYDTIISEIDKHVRMNGRTVNGMNNLPILVEASNRLEAEEIAPRVRDLLKNKYAGKPVLQMDEIRYYLKALFFLALASRPSNVYVLDREYKLISK